jgi:hypothetical protein
LFEFEECDNDEVIRSSLIDETKIVNKGEGDNFNCNKISDEEETPEAFDFNELL